MWKAFDVVTPHVFGAVETGYDSNVLRTDEELPGVNVVDEPYTRGEGGLRLDTQLADHLLSLEYRARVTEYWNTGSFDTFEQSARARLDLFFTDVAVHGDMGYARNEYPQSIQLRGLIRQSVYDAKLWTEVSLAKVGFRVGGFGERVDYHKLQLRNLDYRSGGANAQFFVEIFPKLHVLAEYTFSGYDYDEGRDGTLNDYVLHTAFVGIRGELTPKLNASIKVGYSYQDVRSGPNPDDRDYQGFSGEASVRWAPLVPTAITATAARRIEPSVNSNFLLTDSCRLSASQGFFEEGDLTAAAYVGYSHSRVQPGRHISQFETGASLTWQIKQWLSVASTYSFEKLISTFPNSDYVDHTVTISVGVGF